MFIMYFINFCILIVKIMHLDVLAEVVLQLILLRKQIVTQNCLNTRDKKEDYDFTLGVQ